jgi:nitrate reductase gamma subunit
MTKNEMLFVVFPYVALAIAVVVSVTRWRLHPFSVSSLSSQLLESRRLYWGSVPFHWGLSLILL